MISVLSLTSKNLPSCLLYKNISECFKYFSIPHWDEGTLSVEVLRRHYRREFPIMAPGYSFGRLLQWAWFRQGLFPTAHTVALVPSSWSTSSFSSAQHTCTHMPMNVLLHTQACVCMYTYTHTHTHWVVYLIECFRQEAWTASCRFPASSADTAPHNFSVPLVQQSVSPSPVAEGTSLGTLSQL